MRDGFGAVSRDGAGTLEVQQRLQQTLGGLLQHPDEGLRTAARAFAKQALARGIQAMPFEPDHEALRASAHNSVRED